jgi:hypothetical protein
MIFRPIKIYYVSPYNWTFWIVTFLYLDNLFLKRKKSSLKGKEIASFYYFLWKIIKEKWQNLIIVITIINFTLVWVLKISKNRVKWEMFYLLSSNGSTFFFSIFSSIFLLYVSSTNLELRFKYFCIEIF